MDLKNYLLEYVSSGRRNKNIPVEPDTALKVGEIVRIKDEEWFDSLEKDDSGIMYINYPETVVLIPSAIREYSGYTVEISKRKITEGGLMLYHIKSFNTNDKRIKSFVVTNDMLEYA